MNLDDVSELTGLNLYSRDYDSVGGYMIQLLGHLPKEDEQAEDDHAAYQVVSAAGNRIRNIKITLKDR